MAETATGVAGALCARAADRLPDLARPDRAVPMASLGRPVEADVADWTHTRAAARALATAARAAGYGPRTGISRNSRSASAVDAGESVRSELPPQSARRAAAGFAAGRAGALRLSKLRSAM